MSIKPDVIVSGFNPSELVESAGALAVGGGTVATGGGLALGIGVAIGSTIIAGALFPRLNEDYSQFTKQDITREQKVSNQIAYDNNNILQLRKDFNLK